MCCCCCCCWYSVLNEILIYVKTESVLLVIQFLSPWNQSVKLIELLRMFRPLNRYDNLKKEPLSLMHKTTLNIICKILKIDDRFFSVSLATTQNNYDWRWALFFFQSQRIRFQLWISTLSIFINDRIQWHVKCICNNGDSSRKRRKEAISSVTSDDWLETKLTLFYNGYGNKHRDIYQLGVMYTIGNRVIWFRLSHWNDEKGKHTAQQ